jgi:hypothetical protein
MANYARRLVHTSGMEEISAVLRRIPEDLRTDITARAVEAGAKPMVEAAKRNARRSVRTGALYLALGDVVRKYPKNATAVAIVGVRRGYYRGRQRLEVGKDVLKGSESPSHYGHLVEFGHWAVSGGTRKATYSLKLVGIGKFSSKGKELKRWRRDKVLAQGKGKVVGWVAPRPYLRPAFLSTKQQVARAMHEEIMRGVQRSVRRLVKTGAHKH